MPINILANFCHNQHNRNGQCVTCQNTNCPGTCQACLENIHNIGVNQRTYDCRNMIYCYTCHHIHRYSSEIEYVLRLYYQHVLFNNDCMSNVCSIGCGPCSELFALKSFQHIINYKFGYRFRINYYGFDLNNIWTPIHNQVAQIFPNETTFIYTDVFQYYLQNDNLPNIIILNYVLSDILRMNRVAFNDFINNLCMLYQRLAPQSMLIINDINLGRNDNEVRWYYNELIQRLSQCCERIDTFHFAYNQDAYYRYGYKHQYNQVLGSVSPVIQNAIFNPWLECRSAQCVFIKQ